MTSALPAPPTLELAAAPAGAKCCVDSEAATFLRVTGGWDDNLIVDAHLTSAAAAGRLARRLGTGQPRAVAGGYRIGPIHPAAATRLGLIDHRGRRIVGLPPKIIAAPRCCAAAAWRAVLLTGIRVEVRSRQARLIVPELNLELAMALTGLARRLDVHTAIRPRGDRQMLLIADHRHIARLLTAAGAPGTAGQWARWEPPPRPEPDQRAVETLLASNAGRATVAAERILPAVRGALDALGDRAPAHLAATGRLRLARPELSLEALGGLHCPAVSKDTVAGRIRRLVDLGADPDRQRRLQSRLAAGHSHTR